jgi:hypothetical protein
MEPAQVIFPDFSLAVLIKSSSVLMGLSANTYEPESSDNHWLIGIKLFFKAYGRFLRVNSWVIMLMVEMVPMLYPSGLALESSV